LNDSVGIARPTSLFTLRGRFYDSAEVFMRMIKWLAGLFVASLLGSLPSCGTMGGGGMKYFVDPPGVTSDRII
jgi:hypothetical protein